MFPHFNHLQNPIFDALLCQEECFDDDFDSLKLNKNPIFTENDAFWENDELVSLLSKEKNQSFCFSYHELGSLKDFRTDGVKWMLKVVSRYGFSAMTAVLAVNYYDRFVTTSYFQKDKIWMSQLATVACLSLAAKMEETHVPLLLDFQVEECKYVFEAKTIQRMEILVLSTLGWKMSPVTPIAFFDHFVRRFDLLSDLHCEFMGRCETVILSVINDSRLAGYLPSIIAAATMVYVISEIKPCDAVEYHNHLMNLLEITKEKIDSCHKLIKEVLNDYCRKICHKRKYEVIPSSPSGVIDAYFSSESSNDSWAISPVASSVSSSAEPLFKRNRSSDPR